MVGIVDLLATLEKRTFMDGNPSFSVNWKSIMQMELRRKYAAMNRSNGATMGR